MTQITSKQRAELRALSNSLSAIVTIGKAGVTPEIVKMADEALEARELVKFSVLDNTETPVDVCARMCAERARAELIQVIGRKFVLYRKSTNPKTEARKDTYEKRSKR
ncbi:MAG: YhbY family RNA-binding protein [Defluviitaleaceae bacterium]|nr:YhbY family RNA-binding protein [Defluviitaleaceae bacterium]